MIAQATADALVRLDNRSTAQIEDDGFIGERTRVPTGAAGRALPHEASVAIQNRRAHTDARPVCNGAQRAARTRRDALEFVVALTEIAGDSARIQVGCCKRNAGLGGSEGQSMIGARLYALTTANASRQELWLRESARWSQARGRVCFDALQQNSAEPSSCDEAGGGEEFTS